MKDFKMTDSWDLVVGPTGDLELVDGDEQIAQEILFRLKTQKGDYLLSPHIGASLEKYIGQPNEPATHFAIESDVFTALTFDGLIYLPQVDCFPVSDNEVMVLVEFESLNDDNVTVQVSAGLDLREGLVTSRSGTRIT